MDKDLLLKFLKKNRGTWFTTKQLCEVFKETRESVFKSCEKLLKYGDISKKQERINSYYKQLTNYYSIPVPMDSMK